MLRLCALLVAAVALAACGPVGPTHDPAGDRAAIEASLRQWRNDFNATSRR